METLRPWAGSLLLWAETLFLWAGSLPLWVETLPVGGASAPVGGVLTPMGGVPAPVGGVCSFSNGFGRGGTHYFLLLLEQGVHFQQDVYGPSKQQLLFFQEH